MFSTNESLLDWLNHFADPSLQQILPGLNEAQLNKLREVYNEYGNQEENADLTKVSTALGRSVPGFMEVAKAVPALGSGPAKKAFVVENAVALFRLIDGGPEGNRQQFMADQAMYLPTAFPNGPEADLVRPMADQTVERCYELMKKMANP